MKAEYLLSSWSSMFTLHIQMKALICSNGQNISLVVLHANYYENSFTAAAAAAAATAATATTTTTTTTDTCIY